MRAIHSLVGTLPLLAILDTNHDSFSTMTRSRLLLKLVLFISTLCKCESSSNAATKRRQEDAQPETSRGLAGGEYTLIRRRLLDGLCPVRSESEAHVFETVVLVDVEGRPGEFSTFEEMSLLTNFKASCSSKTDLSSYEWKRATLLRDENVDNMEFGSTLRNFTIAISLEVETNLVELDHDDAVLQSTFTLFADDYVPGVQISASTNSMISTACDCAFPTKEALLARLQVAVGLVLPSIETVHGLRSTLPAICPLEELLDNPLSSQLAIEVAIFFEDEQAEAAANLGEAWDAMGKHIMYTYNMMQRDRCDPFARAIKGYTLVAANKTGPLLVMGASSGDAVANATTSLLGGRALVETASLAPTGAPSPAPTQRGADLFTLVFELQGDCYGCPSQQQLFFDAVSNGRRLSTQDRQFSEQSLSTSPKSSSTTPTPFDGGRRELEGSIYQDEGGICYCPVEIPGSRRSLTQSDPLTSADYRERLNDEIVSSRPEIMPLYVVHVTTVNEVIQVDCPVSVQEPFEGFVATTFSGNISDFLPDETGEARTGSQVQLVQDAMVQAFNTLASTGCDPQTRYWSAATLAEVIPQSAPLQRRFLQDQFLDLNATLASNETGSPTWSPTMEPTASPTMSGADLFGLVFSIQGMCSGCTQETPMFDELTVDGRKLLEGTTSFQDIARQRFEQEVANQCFCAIGSVQRAPTSAEYFLVFREYLASLGVESKALSAEAVNNFAPSSEPSTSSKPSPFPSLFPSSFPSQFPSSFPTTSTAKPSNMPSLEPSAQPSDMPSLKPSVEPSDSPTIFPSLRPSDNPSEKPSPRPTKAEPSDAPSQRPTRCPDLSQIPDLPSPGDLFSWEVLPTGTPGQKGSCEVLPTEPATSRFMFSTTNDGSYRIRLQCCATGTIVVKQAGCPRNTCVGTSTTISDTLQCLECTGNYYGVENPLNCDSFYGNSVVVIDIQTMKGEVYFVEFYSVRLVDSNTCLNLLIDPTGGGILSGGPVSSVNANLATNSGGSITALDPAT